MIAISENFTFAGTLGATFGPHLILGFSLYFLISLSLTFKLFGNVWGSLHTKSLITWMKDICICYSLNIVIMNYLIAIMNCNNEHTSNSKSFILYIKRNKKKTQQEDCVKVNPNNTIWNWTSPTLSNYQYEILRYALATYRKD